MNEDAPINSNEPRHSIPAPTVILTNSTVDGGDYELLHDHNWTTEKRCSSTSSVTVDHTTWEMMSPDEKREEEKKIVHALDWRMMPLFCIFYFADFLDRANIGNATLAGIQKDLNLTPQQLGIVISAFYITYILFEIPSNVILKQTNAVAWLSTIMLVWGVVTLAMGFASKFGGLLAARLLLGAAESGYIPGILYQMSRVYKPRELNSRIGFLLCMAFVSGIVSGPIAYGTSFLEGQNGLHGWQYLFILEGVPTIVLSIVSYFCLFDDIKEVSWLTPAQKAFQIARMAEDGEPNTKSSSIRWSTIYAAFADWKTWLFSAVYVLNAVNITSYSVFSPMLIDGFGFPVLTSQLLTAPPSLLASVIVLLGGFLADRYNRRTPILIVGFSTMAMGYMMLLLLSGRWALYGALFIIPCGMALQAPAIIGWSAVNYPDLSVRAVAVAVVIMFGNSGSVVASFLYPSSDAPHYRFGNTFNLVCAISGVLVSVMTGYLLQRENQKREKLLEKALMHQHDNEKAWDDETIKELGVRFYC